MSEQEVRSLKNKRGLAKAKLTRFLTFLDNFKNSLEINKTFELQARLDAMPLIKSEFEVIQNQIEELDDNEFKASSRETFEEAYFKAIADGTRMLHAQNSVVTNAVTQTINYSKNILPPMILPVFNGDYHKWLNVIHRFNAVVDQTEGLSVPQIT